MFWVPCSIAVIIDVENHKMQHTWDPISTPPIVFNYTNKTFPQYLLNSPQSKSGNSWNPALKIIFYHDDALSSYITTYNWQLFMSKTVSTTNSFFLSHLVQTEVQNSVDKVKILSSFKLIIIIIRNVRSDQASSTSIIV